MEDSSEAFNQVVSNLRACLISTQGGIPISSINNDYKQLLGENIPFKKLGFSTLEELLNALPGIKIRKRGNESIIEAEAAENSEHISKLVERQRKSTGRVRRRSAGPAPPLPASRKPPTELKASRKLIKPQGQPQRANGNVAPGGSGGDTQQGNRPKAAQSSIKKRPQPLMEIKIPAPADASNNSSGGRQTGSPGYPGSGGSLSPTSPLGLLARPKQPGSGRLRHGGDHHQQQQVHQPGPLSPHLPPTPPPDLQYRNPAQQRLLQKRNELPVSTEHCQHPAQPSTSKMNEHHNQYQPHHHQLAQYQPHHQSAQQSRHYQRQNNHTLPDNYTKLTAIQEGPNPYLKGSYIDRLIQEMNKHGCQPPTFVLLPRKPKGDGVYFSCRIIVNFPEHQNSFNRENDFSTFPEEFQDRNAAKEKVAEKAYTELFVKHQPKNMMMATTENRDLVVSRVVDIVDGRTQGVWIYHIAEDYEKKFNEKLPNNWLNLIRNCPKLKAEKLTENSSIVRAVNSNNVLNGNVIQQKITEYLTPPPKLVLPNSSQWDVFITRTINSSKVWLRFVGEEYSALFDFLATKMENFYEDACEVMARPHIERNRFYAMVGPDGCARVKLLDVITNNSCAPVSFIDHGDEDLITISTLYPLDHQFCDLAAQAVQCGLYGLEKYEDNSVLNQLLSEYIEGKVLVGEVVSLSPIKLILHDTSGDNPVNLNNFLGEIMELVECKPDLKESKSVHEVVLTHISNSGDVYLQFPSKVTSYINKYLEGVSADIYEKNRITNKSMLQHHRIYLTRSGQRGPFVRVKIIGNTRDKVDVQCIDYGTLSAVHYSELFDSEDVAIDLNVIPPQCVRVQLKEIPQSAFKNNAFINALLDLVPINQRVLVKMDSLKIVGDEEVPVVELFKRIQPGNLLISINYTLGVNKSGLFGQESLVQPLKNTTLTQIKHELKLAKTAKINEKHFKVYVVSASNPFNFVIQPLTYRLGFKTLLANMAKFYSVEGQGRLFTDIRESTYCTAFIERLNGWYRGCIDKIVSDDDVSFYACDLGEMHVINANSLRILEQEFMELPALAFTAKLTNIIPLHSDWLVDDARYFQKLTENKEFISVIQSKTNCGTNKVLLGLKLIDTSSESQVDIAHTFVVERRAKYI